MGYSAVPTAYLSDSIVRTPKRKSFELIPRSDRFTTPVIFTGGDDDCILSREKKQVRLTDGDGHYLSEGGGAAGTHSTQVHEMQEMLTSISRLLLIDKLLLSLAAHLYSFTVTARTEEGAEKVGRSLGVGRRDNSIHLLLVIEDHLN